MEQSTSCQRGASKKEITWPQLFPHAGKSLATTWCRWKRPQLRRGHLKMPQKLPAKHGFSSERKKGKSKEEREGEGEGDRTSVTFKREKGPS
jgi:hypothetical protein